MKSDLDADLATRSQHNPATYILKVTGLVEAGTGLTLLLFPFAVLHLLLGVGSAAVETSLTARLAGAALLCFGGTCWFAHLILVSSAIRGILATVAFYDLLAAFLLAYSGLALNLSGVALWPAVVAHILLAVWGVIILTGFRYPPPQMRQEGTLKTTPDVTRPGVWWC